MRHPLYAAAAVVMLAVSGVAAIYALRPLGLNPGSEATPGQTVQQTPAASLQQTQPASPPPSPHAPAFVPTGAIDTTGWTIYESDRYGFSIGHPSDWTVVPADHDWTLAADAADPMSTGQEAFIGPNVRVSGWSVPVDRRTTPETPGVVEAWVEAYCEQAGGAPCPGIGDVAQPLCVEVRDCHPGLLVPFESEVMAFFTGGLYPDQMVVVAVWWGEDEPAVEPYGGSQRLLEAFLTTMQVYTERARDERIGP